jgi:hypothetical protein
MRPVARNGENGNIYGILMGKPDGKRPICCPRCRFEDTIKMDITWQGLAWTNLVHDTDSWWNLLYAVRKFQFQ